VARYHFGKDRAIGALTQAKTRNGDRYGRLDELGSDMGGSMVDIIDPKGVIGFPFNIFLQAMRTFDMCTDKDGVGQNGKAHFNALGDAPLRLRAFYGRQCCFESDRFFKCNRLTMC
jgi:hypothetical protein